ncbi:DUF1178 family protein [Limnohabitans sp. Rim28]|uniref:DUF1178 family protein n=1 Tax=Limnohabitans sp. Rim28 TaxID=1100720 RepID=UPI0004745904|nr:DUF1178 family protein [Limnohabitans sp. Rim28]PVE09737.1 hypothetical protein B472_02055 [Limnohabitans sp. Rim28]
MKVLDLQCRFGHSFEGWFGSQADYDAQRERGLVTCPVCSDSEITKMLSAPRLNLGHGTAPAFPPGQGGGPAAGAGTSANVSATRSEVAAPAVPEAQTELAQPSLQQIQAAMVNMVRHVMANTEDVGSQFAEEARKIHYGESEERNIRGQATREETEALIDEGIEVMALPVPDNLKGPLQ